MNHDIRIPSNQPGFNGKSGRFFFRGSIGGLGPGGLDSDWDRGTSIRIPNHRAPNHQFEPLVDQGCFRFLSGLPDFLIQRYIFTNKNTQKKGRVDVYIGPLPPSRGDIFF